MDHRDFEDLWPTTINKLTKIRYNLYIVENDVEHLWEVDAFKDDLQDTYIVVAEYEMEEGQEHPGWIPPIISENLIYEVPLLDDRFGSKKLADPEYARTLLE